MKSEPTTAMKDKPEPSNARFNFPKGAKYQAKGIEKLSIKDVVTVTIKGKVKSVSMRDNMDGYGNGKDFEVEITSCAIGNDNGDDITYEGE